MVAAGCERRGALGPLLDHDRAGRGLGDLDGAVEQRHIIDDLLALDAAARREHGHGLGIVDAHRQLRRRDAVRQGPDQRQVRAGLDLKGVEYDMVEVSPRTKVELPELPDYEDDEDYESGKSAAEARIETGFMSRLFKPKPRRN